MYNLKGKVALISGGSRGIGFSMAQALAAKGAKILITARGEDRLEDSRKKLTEMGFEVSAVTGDVGVWKDAQRIVDYTVDKYQYIDILINNAGISMRGKFEMLSPEVCRKIIETNLLGSIYLTRAAVSYVKKRKGQIVFISSIAGVHGFPGSSIYGVSKGGLRFLSESLRFELNQYGVNIGIAYLGYTEHDPEKRILGEDGSLILPDRPGTYTQKRVAGLILNMIEKQKEQIVTTFLGKLCYTFYRISPLIINKVVSWGQKQNIQIYRKCY
jgi:short-subunit dehydrogenase